MKNILLLFLSDVKISKEGKISTAKYKEIGETETTNESAVRYLSKIKNAPPDKIFYFASKKVQKPIENFQVDGKTISHVEYFEKRIAGDIPAEVNIKKVMEPCEFKEDADISQTMDSVIEMASKIQEYVKAQNEVTLHVDMTGGMRHASLMMLVITRLIQYSGVKIGYILYSNYDRDRAKRGEFQFVEEANNIYNLFDVISGAEEFVRFGSVDAIKNYFEGRVIPPVLQDLLNAMSKFADAIKISRRAEFDKALKGLQVAYNKFNAESENQDINYKLMQQLKIRITQEYSTLLTEPTDNYISIIDWCLKHDYIQQALVLYTEAFPYQIIAKNKILTLNPALNAELAKKVKKDNMNRESEYFLLNDFKPQNYNDAPIFEAYDDFIGKLKTAIQSIRLNKFDMDTFKNENNFEEIWENRGIIKSDYDNYLELLQELQKLKVTPNLAADLKTIAENLPTLYSFWYLISEDIFKTPANGRVKEILMTLEDNQKEKKSALRRKSDNTLATYYRIKNGMLILHNITEENFLNIIDRYFTIKSERNDIVHARKLPKGNIGGADSEKSYAAILKEYMAQGLKEYSDAV